MILSITKRVVLIWLLVINSIFATETKKTIKMHPLFFGFPGAVSNLTDASFKYYHYIKDSNRTNGSNLEYFSVLHQETLDSALLYIDSSLSKTLYVGYNQNINIEPVTDHRQRFNPISEACLEIHNSGYRPKYHDNQNNLTTEQQRINLLYSNSSTPENINIEFNDIIQAFNEYFIKHEVLIKTNIKYFLKMPYSGIENKDLFLTIVIKKNKENLETDYFIVHANCKIACVDVITRKKKNITIINTPKDKRIHNIIEKFDFDCSQFGIGGVTSSIKLFVETFIAPRLLEKKMREKINMNISRGGILYGPPGTGKTLFISAIKNIMEANNLKVKVIKISGPEIFSRYVGDSEESVRKIFTQANDVEDDEIAIVLIDEIDAMLAKRGSAGNSSAGTDRVVNQFLTCLDGIDQKNENQCNIIVFGTTNRLDLIDNAVTRPGRMDVKIAFNLPNNEQRKEIFEIQTNCLAASGFLNPNVNFQDLASKTSGYTGAEIASIVQKAQLAAIRDAQGLTPEDNYFYPNKIYNLESLDVNNGCFDFAISKIQPQFGQKSFMDTTNKSFDYYKSQTVIQRLKQDIATFKNSTKLSTLLIHITGKSKVGKTTLAALAVENFDSSCHYLPAKDCAPYSREGKKGVIIDALKTGDLATETNNFSVVLDDFDDIIEYDPAMAYNVPLVSIVKSYAKSNTIDKVGKLLIILISSQGAFFLRHIFNEDGSCIYDLSIKNIDSYEECDAYDDDDME
jgi:ATP-dependent 26S proteasome regulatory subunit